MNPMHKVSAAVLLAATLMVPAIPAFAATMDAAKVTVGMKADAVPVSNLVSMIGRWTSADLTALGKATNVKTYDTRTLYPAADLTKIATAETVHSADLTKFRAAIKADSALNGWFTTNHIDVNRVIAVADPSGTPAIFLY